MIFTKNKSIFLNLLLFCVLSISTNILYGMQGELVLLPKTFFDNTDNSSPINLPQDTPKSINKDGSLSDIKIDKTKLSLLDNKNLIIEPTPAQKKIINIYTNNSTQNVYIITEQHYVPFNLPENSKANASPSTLLETFLKDTIQKKPRRGNYSSSSSDENLSTDILNDEKSFTPKDTQKQ